MRRLAVLLTVLALPAVAGESSLEETVQLLETAHRRLQTLQAEFTQSLHSMVLAEPQEESGTLYLQRPAKLRWEYRRPEEKLAVVDGERTWLYVPAEGQVFVGSLEEVRRGGALALLLGDSLDLHREFRVEPVLDPSGKPLSRSLSLVPKTPSDEFERVDVTVGKDGLPRHIVVHGVLGDVMEYRLRDVRTGMKLDGSLFRFRPPTGVDVVPAE